MQYVLMTSSRSSVLEYSGLIMLIFHGYTTAVLMSVQLVQLYLEMQIPMDKVDF